MHKYPKTTDNNNWPQSILVVNLVKVAPYSINSNLHLKKDEELKMNYLFQLWVLAPGIHSED